MLGRMTLDAAIANRASLRLGIITNEDLRAVGASRQQTYRRVRDGRWRRLQPGVLAVAASPTTWEQAVLAAVLGAGQGAVASHSTAARLWGFPDFAPLSIEVSVPRGRQPRLQGVRLHRVIDVPPEDRSEVRSIPATSASRTLVDLSGSISLGQLARTLDHGLRRCRALGREPLPRSRLPGGRNRERAPHVR